VKFRFLGTGTSVGVPQIGCKCRVCTSKDPRDSRRRCGAWVSDGETAFLVDTPPELRLACVEYGIDKVDAVLLTHAHMDHVAAFDDLRRFNTINGEKVPCDPSEPGANGRDYRIVGRTMKCYALPETIEQMHRIFPYITTRGGEKGLFRPQIEFVDCTKPFSVGALPVESFLVEHGFPCCGYVIGSKIAYASDCCEMSDEVVERLKGIDTLVIDCLRKRVHPTHLNLEKALAYIGRISPRRAFLTHLCHDFTHEEWLSMLPDGVSPAYDGLVVS